MVTTEPQARRNGTGAPTFPIKTITLQLDEIGYTGWTVTLRINPRSSTYDDLVSGDEVRWWVAFGLVVSSWNFVDEDDVLLPLPGEVMSEKELDLPIGLLSFVLTRYIEAVRAASAVPKAPSDRSDLSSSISEGSPKSG